MKYLILQSFAWLPNSVCSIFHNTTLLFPLCISALPELRQLRRKQRLRKILQEMYTAVVLSFLLLAVFRRALLRLRVLAAVPQPVQHLLCHGGSPFHTCALIPRWDGAAGGDPALGHLFDPPRVGWRAAQLGSGSTLMQEWGSGSLSKTKEGRNHSQV